MINRVKNFRLIAISEGISFLVLLMVAMPMKYYMNLPQAVKLVGWIHGVLFIAYMIAMVMCIGVLKWNWFKVLIAFVASLIPFGTFVLDQELKRKQRELEVLK